jgi:hypothetical protein
MVVGQGGTMLWGAGLFHALIGVLFAYVLGMGRR